MPIALQSQWDIQTHVESIHGEPANKVHEN